MKGSEKMEFFNRDVKRECHGKYTRKWINLKHDDWRILKIFKSVWPIHFLHPINRHSFSSAFLWGQRISLRFCQVWSRRFIVPSERSGARRFGSGWNNIRRLLIFVRLMMWIWACRTRSLEGMPNRFSWIRIRSLWKRAWDFYRRSFFFWTCLLVLGEMSRSTRRRFNGFSRILDVGSAGIYIYIFFFWTP